MCGRLADTDGLTVPTVDLKTDLETGLPTLRFLVVPLKPRAGAENLLVARLRDDFFPDEERRPEFDLE